jgi:1,4-dihydroxy-2-naphthoyl-CoA hydrolase
VSPGGEGNGSAEADATALDLNAAMPFGALLGVELEAASPEEVRGGLAWAPERCTAGGVLHGGALIGLADSLGGLCAYLNLPEGASATATVESKTNFFRAVRRGRVTAVARPLHVGRTFIVVQSDLRDDDGRHVAQVTQTQAVLGGS